MREILFRGFHPCDGPETIVVDGEKVKGRWVEGLCFLQDHDGNAAIGDKIYTKSVYQYQKEWILITGYGAIGLPVIADTVGQSTGLTDRTGNRIFEGDVLRITKEALPDVTVKFVNQAWFMCHGEDPVALLCQENIEGFGTEVIGTTFDEEAENA